jgi:hypothetical protein
LRGAGPALTVVVSVDEQVVSSLGTTTRLGNTIALQVRRPKIEGQAAADWAQTAFKTFCKQFSPVWGGGGHPAEYWAKVMTEQPPIRALGWDLGRFLPAVLWLNFFGRPYRQLIGEDRLQSTPASLVIPTDQQKVRDHLGANLFFSKPEPHRPTIAPQW